ncbi:CGNR zinc finger domain-containing protein [Rhodococcoides kyotonense]|uniref:CGNR zinc finger domain-containing protein n=1 Tax=Rhodococcoides kyotonense TaxID=398843 RepID=A0A239IVK2_9NOCA|nr:CGNR zinc finger domain-containing protein [Rhodococcus kyotonensis]SNS96454.1 CGNR zinc finger domain-containing protein [Rhodococcus kyotonensis]
MVDSANSRYGVTAAPDGLDIVQELLNTASAGLRDPTPDLLAESDTAQRWADAALVARGLPPASVDAESLRALRETIRAAVSGDTASIVPHLHSVALTLDESGTVVAGLENDVAGLVFAEMLRAQARGEWSRLKLCALGQCSVAFHDRSKNRSARYHAARCANYVNLRNSRARNV